MEYPKNLTCNVCLKQLSIQDENFPEDLFHLLTANSIPGLYWYWNCESCEKSDSVNGPEEALDLKDKVKLLEYRVKNLEFDMCKIKDSVNHKALKDDSDFDTINNRSLLSPPGFPSGNISGEFNSEDSGLFNSDVSGYQDSVLENNSSTNYGRAHSSPMPAVFNSNTPYSVNRSVPSDDPPKKQNYKEALTIIHELINTKIKIDANESTKSSNVVTDILKDMIPAFKKQSVVFASMYERDYKTGSSYNDLKISSASEYDIEIVLKAPSRITFEVEFFPQTMTFAKLKWKKVADFPENKMKILKFFEDNSENNNLMPLKVSAWFQGLIDVYLKSNPKIEGIKSMKNCQSGPARTIEIETTEGYKISIDLLPAIVFSYDVLKGTKIDTILEKYPVDKSKRFWFLVTKTCKGGDVPLLSTDCDFSWRVDFPEVERKVLYNKQSAKNVVKLLKLLRDIHKWNIASYHLKTLILWAINSNPETEYWHGSVLFDRYLEALTSLQKYVEIRHLPYFMDDSYNLFHFLNKDECRNLSNRLQHVIDQIKSDCTDLRVIYS